MHAPLNQCTPWTNACKPLENRAAATTSAHTGQTGHHHRSDRCPTCAQDLAVWDLEHFSWIVRGDGRTSDLKRAAVQRRLTIDLVAMSRKERSSKLLKNAALASCVFGVLVDGARVIEVTPAVSSM
jgi:hypothetical protein